MDTSSERKDKTLNNIRISLTILCWIAILAVCKVTAEVSITLLLSIFIFLMVLPLVTSLEKAKVPSWLATILAVILIILVIVLACWFVFYAVDILITKLPEYTSKVGQVDNLVTGLLGRWIDLPEDFSLLSGIEIDWIGSVVMPTLRTVSGSAISIVSNAGVTLLLCVFLLMERHSLVPKIGLFAKDEDGAQRAANVWDRISKQMSKYISLKLGISIITGLCFYMVAALTHLDFAVIWGVLAVIMNFIPTVGSIVITVLTILMAMIQFLPNWTPILWVAFGTIMTQNLLGNIIEPMVQGNKLNLSAFVIMLSLSVFGYIWGIIGMFLSVPLLSILQIIFANIEETKKFAMLFSSGTAMKELKKHGLRPSKLGRKKQEDDPYSDVMFPDKPE